MNYRYERSTDGTDETFDIYEYGVLLVCIPFWDDKEKSEAIATLITDALNASAPRIRGNAVPMSTEAYVIRPCVETQEREVHVVPEGSADFWTLYRRGDDGLGMAVCDLITKEDAECILLELSTLRTRLTLVQDVCSNLQHAGKAPVPFLRRCTFRIREKFARQAKKSEATSDGLR